MFGLTGLFVIPALARSQCRPSRRFGPSTAPAPPPAWGPQDLEGLRLIALVVDENRTPGDTLFARDVHVAPGRSPGPWDRVATSRRWM
jgi:hypothetical protein